jgi:CheY-like chemotaxis protein
MDMDVTQTRILVVDDDALSRELIALLLEREGYEVETADSGDEALRHLVEAMGAQPSVVLADMQMPGIAGVELVRRMRALCGVGTVLLAMSGSSPEEATRREFDGFLRKPFTMEALAAAIVGGSAEAEDGARRDASALDESVYKKLSASMPRKRLQQLYALCLSDTEMRLGLMRRAQSNGDGDSYRREAHAIKGGCGMVGAMELQRLATLMEEPPLSGTNHVVSFDEFNAACERLRRILDERASGEKTSGIPGEGAL